MDHVGVVTEVYAALGPLGPRIIVAGLCVEHDSVGIILEPEDWAAIARAARTLAALGADA